MTDSAAEGLAGVLIKALRRLGTAGQPEAASRLAAEAYSSVRRTEPRIGSRIDGVMHHLARLEAAATAETTAERSTLVSEDLVLDVRTEPPVRRHALIFETFDKLVVGSAFVLVNDHDPKPLYYQLAAEQGGTFSWDYLEEGPQVWRVRIARTAAAQVAKSA
jgi:uncharacterized protein (DUF2249 family)